MLPQADVSGGDFRVLDADTRLVVPYGVRSRVLISAADVIHAWSLPALGVKVDATPGRLGQVFL